MKKSTKSICIISGILLGLIALYLAGAVILRYMGLEYRSWVSKIGKCLIILVFPPWVMGLSVWKLWQCFREKTVGRWLAGLFGAVVALFGFVWSIAGVFLIALSTYEDHYLGSGLVSVAVDSFPKSVSYEIYESVGPFFRRKTVLTHEKTADYLTDRYHREFYPVEEDGETLYVGGKEAIKTAVEYVNGELRDSYPQALAEYYLAEGFQVSEMDWDTGMARTSGGEEHFCLILDQERNFSAFGSDIYRLMQYALEQDSLLEESEVYVYFSMAGYEGCWGREGFGSNRDWEDSPDRDHAGGRTGVARLWEAIREQYSGEETDAEARVTQLVKWELDAIRLRAERERIRETETAQGSRSPQESETGFADTAPVASVSVPEPTPELTVREMAEAEYPEQCTAAEVLWEEELRDLGYDYEPGFNAKGNLVIWLGKLPSDNLQSSTAESDYYLTYDRESRNGNCYLFVLSEVPEGQGLNDAYLREFYACEKGTLKVAVGNKTSWSQTGSAAYRELTGE